MENDNPSILNDNERRALRFLSSVLIEIRQACRGPVTPEVVRLIYDLAGAVHEVASRTTVLEQKDLQCLIDAGIDKAQEAHTAFKKHKECPAWTEHVRMAGAHHDGGSSPVFAVALAFTKWLLATFVYACLAPWLLLALFAFLLSLVSSPGSMRELITDLATADSAAWRQGADAWHGIAVSCFVAVLALRLIGSPFVKSLGRRVRWQMADRWRMADWVDSHIPHRQRNRVWVIALGSLIVGTVALVLFAARTDNIPALNAAKTGIWQARKEPPAAMPLHFGSSAALSLPDGRVVSGDAAVSVLPSGEYVVRFQAPEHPLTR
jgi:hypothetical protein